MREILTAELVAKVGSYHPRVLDSHHLRFLCDSHEALRAKLAEAEKDTARLDWVLNNKAVVLDGCIWTGEKPWKYREPNHGISSQGLRIETLNRAAIDAAMEGK